VKGSLVIADWIKGAAGRLQMRHFAASVSGNVAMLFALACFVIFPMLAFAVEVTRMVSHKASLQYSTDAAVLAAAQAVFMTSEERRGVVDSFMAAEETKLGTQITYELIENDDGELSLSSRIMMPLIIGRILSSDDIRIEVRSDAMMGGADLEVSLILDTTGSMAGTRITALRQAALDFVDIVVNDVQEPFYSKVALVPYSVSVNAGPYAEGLRGSITPGRNISGAVWLNGPVRNITGATRANPVTITSAGHGLLSGDRIRITAVSGMTQLNNNIYTVGSVTAGTFTLLGVNSSGFSNYSSGGQIRRCLNTNCEVTVTASNHGFSTHDRVVINNVAGMTQINNAAHATWTVTRQDANNFMLQGSQGWNYGVYSSGGIAYCTTYGCERFRFINAQGNQRVNHASVCVTERPGTAAFRDTSPATAPLTIHYDNPAANPCANVREIVPLTSNKSLLNARINSLFAGGSTSGHLGAAFGWYVLSPNFAHLFPPASRPASYGRPRLFKVAVLMTDGQFNSSFCDGVISRISLAGSGSVADFINCDSPNGGAYAQALALCSAMRSAGITIYTVGFEIGNIPNALVLMNQCASSPQHVFNASGSAALREVFIQIAQSIEEVRLTR
jgi:Flp pilus assembly protein TadG